ncbi:DUF4365 domain-containing protein [uncultured Draconibacterium sp.]|uniref:DUF4365 domain-containing protein n=1 Tax=uncultured Draconibacterium sp. TaxID=1573823 RepID=UPI0029C687B5|nr:DUF4365 domain-containing protein [uncultured Draconibacterium sp.]
MPKRPKQHRLEDNSRIRFQEVLPEMWVYRDKDKDYGIDAEVELFDNDENAQGLVFWVQLKATESKEKSSILNIDLEIDTLKYYKSLEIPVLLVRYSAYENSIYIKWVDNIDLYFSKKDAKTFRLKFDDSDKFDEQSPIKIENYLKQIKKLKSGKFRFPLTMELSIVKDKINAFSKSILSAQIRKELKKYSDFILVNSKPSNSIITVTLDNEELKIDISNLAGCTFHSIKSRDKDNFSEFLVKDILLGVAVSMIQLGQVEYCGRIIFENKLETRLIEKPELIAHLIIPLFYSSFFKETILIFEKLLEDEKNIELNIVSHFHILLASNANNPEKNTEIENFFKRAIRKAKEIDRQQIGIANYNLANHYNSRNMFLEAIHHLNQARKYAPIYWNQYYFCSEMASVFFRSGKYKCASKLYLKSLSIKNDNKTIALYADSLMLAGEYAEATKKFKEYLDNEEKPHEEFVLKHIILSQLLNKFKIKRQTRRIKEARALSIISNLNSKEVKDKLEKALELDLLSDIAWYNLGILHSQRNEFHQATMCFTTSALVNNYDIEAWKNATISSLNPKAEIEILPLIILTAYFFNKDEYLEELYSHIESQANNEFLNKLSKMIDEILPEINDKEKPTIRLFDGKGKFENIEEIITGHNKL